MEDSIDQIIMKAHAHMKKKIDHPSKIYRKLN